MIYKNLYIDREIYHEDIYQGREKMKITGIRKTEIELEGDYSGGTHDVCQRDWLPIEGVLLEKSTKQWNYKIN